MTEPDFSTFACSRESQETITPSLLKSVAVPPAEIYASVSNIRAVAEAADRAAGRTFALMPFCHTVEAKAMGADIKPADDTAGPRAGSFTLPSLEKIAPADIPAHPDAARLLQACRETSSQGRPVVWQLSGPISVISCMMPLSQLFKQWRKNPDGTAAALSVLRENIIAFARAAVQAQAACISYADPPGGLAILGPRYSRMLTDSYTAPFIKELIGICGARTKLVVCPVTASAVQASDRLEYRPGAGDFSVTCIKHIKNISELEQADFRIRG